MTPEEYSKYFQSLKRGDVDPRLLARLPVNGARRPPVSPIARWMGELRQALTLAARGLDPNERMPTFATGFHPYRVNPYWLGESDDVRAAMAQARTIGV